VGVRLLGAEDVVPVAAVLARAFDDDPIFRAILPAPEHRSRALRALFEEWTRILHLPHPTSFTTDEHAGAALWSPPGQWSIGILSLARLAPRMLGALGTRTLPALRVLGALDAPHPHVPHNYLRVIGCDPDRQGQGIGAALLRPMLDRCDERHEPAYLESSNEKNLSFYRRHGFEVTDEVVTHLGPRAWLMWREAR
jgi:ribosomal protein S18 acetylase RimI-like enzyme